MQLYSTKNPDAFVSLAEAVMKGLPDDNGLFMPSVIPTLSPDFFEKLPDLSLPEIGVAVCEALFQGVIPADDIRKIVYDAIDFPAPIVEVEPNVYSLELWHGPSLAFKDFGARFMAQLMSYFNENNPRELVILVATSGDTGGAVAAGFYKALGIKVVILYPKGKVSPLQEKQLTTLGENIRALEIDGTFDDCQALVKQAFLDTELTTNIRLSSANSINIARLIPQSFYYFEAYKQLLNLKKINKPLVFAIPSGNFGNLTAGLLAQRLGLPIHHFIAATNANDVVPQYLQTGIYQPRPSVRTLSNAMDVGAPSNFARMADLFSDDWRKMQAHISGAHYTDEETAKAMQTVLEIHHYLLDPHGAVAYLALKDYLKENDAIGVFLETAHPAKFLDDVEHILSKNIDIPPRLAELSDKIKVATPMNTDFQGFKSWLLANLVY